MVSWTGSRHAYSFDAMGFVEHSLYYLTAVVVASYSAHLLWRLHKHIVSKYGGQEEADKAKKEE